MTTTANVPPSGAVRYPVYGNVTSAAGGLTLTNGFASAERVTAKELFPLAFAQGFMLWFFGNAANNDTLSYRIYLVFHTLGIDGVTLTGTFRVCFGYGTATFGGGPVLGGADASSNAAVADTITWTLATTGTTPKGCGGVLETAWGSAGTAAYSPADDTAAFLLCPHTGWADGLIVEIDPTGTTVDVFCLIARR